MMPASTAVTADLHGASRRVRCLAALALGLLSLLGNMVSLPLFYGIDFIFGSFGVMLALMLLGFAPAVVISLIVSSYTWHLWGHPYAILTFTLETLVVGALYYRRSSGVVQGTIFYWCVLGIPLVFLCYGVLLDLGWESALLIALKQTVNAIFNALLACIALIGFEIYRRGVAWQYMRASEVGRLLFHIILLLIMVAGGLPVIYQSALSQRDMEQRLTTYLRNQAMEVVDRLESRAEDSSNALPILPDDLRLASDVQVWLRTEQGLMDLAGNEHSLMPPPLSSEETPGQLHLARPATTQSLLERTAKAIYWLELDTADYGGAIRGVRVETPALPLLTRAEQTGVKFFFMLSVLMAFGILLAMFLGRLLSMPLTRLARIASDTKNGIIITDTEGRTEWVNAAFTALSGYQLAEMKGKKPGSLLQGPETDQDTVGLIRESLKRSQSFEVDIVNYHQDGTPYWVHIDSNPIRDGAGKLLGFMAIETDITEAKEDDIELRRLKTSLDKTADCVFIFDAESLLFTYVNEGAQNQVGYTEAELFNMHAYDIKPDINTDQFMALIDPLLQGLKSNIQFTTVHQHKNGKRVPVEINLQYVASEKDSPHFLAIVRDISERLAAEQALREQAEQTNAIVDTIVDALIIIDDAGIIQSCNPATKHVFGYDAEELLGRNVKALMPSPDHDAHDGYLKAYQETGEKKIIGLPRVVKAQRKNGEIFPADLSVMEVTVKGERRYVGMVRDITERQRLETLKNEFVSTVSHELRTPLTSIKGALNLVLGREANNMSDKTRTMLEMAERNSERLSLLINDILDLEKIESGNMTFDMARVDLRDLVQRSVEENEGYASKSNVTLEFATTLETAWVSGDAIRLLQVLANFISNAVKYSPEGTAVVLSLETNAEGGYIVKVRDRGPGVPEDFRKHIFSRFAQADGSDTRAKGGTGLGLNICKAIIDRHQGTIGFTNAESGGAEFYFTLTAFDDAPSPSTQQNANFNHHVLVIEDNADVASFLQEMLREEKLGSTVTGSLESARRALSRRTYDLILLDLKLPDGYGLDLLEDIQRGTESEPAPVIVVSGFIGDREQEMAGELADVKDWLRKPLDAELFHRAIENALKRDKTSKILHVEDDPDIAELLRDIVGDLAEIDHATGLATARQRLQARHYDLLVLDLGLEDGDGSTLLSEIPPHCPVIIFSAQTPSDDVSGKVFKSLTKSVATNVSLRSTIQEVLKDRPNE